MFCDFAVLVTKKKLLMVCILMLLHLQCCSFITYLHFCNLLGLNIKVNYFVILWGDMAARMFFFSSLIKINQIIKKN